MQMAVAKLIKTVENNGEGNAYWIRPVSWKGSGAAITFNEERQFIVVNIKNEDPLFCPFEYEILDNWEVVSLKTMFKELGILPKEKT